MNLKKKLAVFGGAVFAAQHNDGNVLHYPRLSKK